METHQTIVVPLGLLLGLLGPLYALVGGLYVLLFRHSNNDDMHLDKKTLLMTAAQCEEVKKANSQQHANLSGYISDVDNRSAKAVEALREDFGKQFDRLYKLIEGKT